MPLIPYPNVPPLPGVPALNRSNNAQFVSAALNVVGQLLPNSLFGQDFSITNSETGAAALVPYSFVSFEIKKESKVPFYPIEQGEFASYNKVQLPAEIRMTCTVNNQKQGLLQGLNVFGLNKQAPWNKAQFLKAMNDLIIDATLLNIITPNGSFPNYTLTHFDYRSEARSGATLLIIQIYFMQVIPGATSTVTATLSPSGASAVNNGQVSPIPASGQSSSVTAQ